MPVLRTLVAKDLRRQVAQPLELIVNLAIPLVLSGLIFLAFGRFARDPDATPTLKLVALDLDDSPLSRVAMGASASGDAQRRLQVTRVASREEGLARLSKDEASALLVIPKGFGAAVLGGGRAELELVKNPSQGVLPIVAEQGASVVALYASVASRLLAEDQAQVKALFEGRGLDDAPALASLFTRLRQRLGKAGDLMLPPLVEVEVKRTERSPAGAGSIDFMGWLFPGMMMMGLLFVSNAQMGDLVREAESGLLRRQLTAPVTPAQLVVAKVASGALVVAVCLGILLLIGAVAFGIDWGDPLRLSAASLAIVLAATAFSAVIFSLAATRRQGDAIGSVLVMVMSLLGGAFFPAEVLPGWLQAASRFTLTYWLSDALRGLVGSPDWARLMTPLMVLVPIALVLSGVAAARLRSRQVRRSA